MRDFKETELRDLRIGEPVDLYVDMYGGRQVIKGRISGLTMGTVRRSPCCRRKTPRQFRQSGASGRRSGSTSKATIRIRTRCSSARPLLLMSTSTSRQPYPMPESSYRRVRLPRKLSVQPATRRAQASDSRRRFFLPGLVLPRLLPWLVAAIVVVPTFMEVLNTTSHRCVALYRGRTAATADDGERVITSYLAAMPSSCRLLVG